MSPGRLPPDLWGWAHLSFQESLSAKLRKFNQQLRPTRRSCPSFSHREPWSQTWRCWPSSQPLHTPLEAEGSGTKPHHLQKNGDNSEVPKLPHILFLLLFTIFYCFSVRSTLQTLVLSKTSSFSLMGTKVTLSQALNSCFCFTADSFLTVVRSFTNSLLQELSSSISSLLKAALLSQTCSGRSQITDCCWQWSCFNKVNLWRYNWNKGLWIEQTLNPNLLKGFMGGLMLFCKNLKWTCVLFSVTEPVVFFTLSQ